MATIVLEQIEHCKFSSSFLDILTDAAILILIPRVRMRTELGCDKQERKGKGKANK